MKYLLVIRGNDTFRHETHFTVSNTQELYLESMKLMAALEKLTIEVLHISSLKRIG